MLNLIPAYGYFAIGTLLYNSGDYQGAISNYSLAIDLGINDGSGYINRGMARSLTGDYERAIEDFSQGIQLNPLNAQAFGERSIARAAIGENQSAIEDSDRCLQLDPQYIRAYYGRAAARSYLGEYEAAMEDFTHLARQDRNAYAEYHLGVLQYLMGMNIAAIKTLTKVMQLEPHFSSALHIRGIACYDLGDEKAASDDFNEVRRIEVAFAGNYNSDKNSEYGFYARGLGWYRSGKQEEAIQDLQTAAAIAEKHKNTAFHQRVMDFLKHPLGVETQAHRPDLSVEN
jgi:tetratricopeptide (TPR) repeat protein